MTLRMTNRSRRQVKGWHVLLAWTILLLVGWFSYTHLPPILGAPLVVGVFVLTFAVNEAYGNGQ